MGKIYKIDSNELEDIIKSIALNNETIIDNSDPVLIFVTIAKYVFNEYTGELDERIGNIDFKQKEIIEEFKTYLEQEKIKYYEDLKKDTDLLTAGIKKSTDDIVKDTLYSVAENVDKINKSNSQLEGKLITSYFYNKLLIAGNIIISLLVLYLLL